MLNEIFEEISFFYFQNINRDIKYNNLHKNILIKNKWLISVFVI